VKKKEDNIRVVLTGTHEGSYGNFRHTRFNRPNNEKIKLNIVKLFFKRIKKKNNLI
jgi:hypothetical protein